MEIPGNVIIELGRTQLRQNPGIHRFMMPWHHDDGYTVMVEVSVEALPCKDRSLGRSLCRPDDRLQHREGESLCRDLSAGRRKSAGMAAG